MTSFRRGRGRGAFHGPGLPHAQREVPILIVLDMNGVLLARKGTDKKLVELRPHLEELLEELDSHRGQLEVAVWSSMMHWNLEPLIDQAFGHRANRLRFVWDQSMCTTEWSGMQKPQKPLLRKDLSTLARSEYGRFVPDRVLLIDDDPPKCKKNPPGTALHPLPFTFDKEDDWGHGDDELIRLADYIHKLVESGTRSVRDYVLRNPYRRKRPENDRDEASKRRRPNPMEGYWPDDDTWLPVTVVEVLEDGTRRIIWEDGSESVVPEDYLRERPGLP